MNIGQMRLELYEREPENVQLEHFPGFRASLKYIFRIRKSLFDIENIISSTSKALKGNRRGNMDKESQIMQSSIGA